MQKVKTLATSRLAVFLGGAALALVVAWPLIGAAQDKSDKPDPHAGHVQPADKPAAADKDLAAQVGELKEKMAKLEAALEKAQPSQASGMSGMGGKAPGGMAPMAGKGGPPAGMGMMGEDASAMGGMGAKKMPGGMGQAKAGMQGGKGMAQGGPGMGGMMAMMGKQMSGMGDMMGMMAKEMGAMPGGAPAGGMAMADDSMEMGGMGGAPGGMAGAPGGMAGAPGGMAGAPGGMGGAPAGGMGMEDDSMEMGAMGGAGGAMGQQQQGSTLPGFPGASHLYHIGAAGFFLNHPKHITLTTEQQTALNGIKQKALLDRATAQRKSAEAEQDLWKLTCPDQPDATLIQAKVHEIESLRAEQRLAFIRSVGEAAKVLTDPQRQALQGTKTTDAPMAQAPAGK